MSSALRTIPATRIDSPIPVHSITYAATHAGHFGSSARIVPGTIQRTAPNARCKTIDRDGQHDPGFMRFPKDGTRIWREWTRICTNEEKKNLVFIREDS